MKRIIILLLIIVLFFSLTACNHNIILIDDYDDESIDIININKNEVKIMQLTDVHLTYGNDYLDKKTYKLINNLITNENPDVIVITGDLFMSIIAPRLLKDFIKFIEKYKTPWTLTFGNHEGEYHKMERIVDILMNAKTNYLYFHYGPKLSNDNSHGYSNFKIRIYNDDSPFLNLYMLDSKDKRKDGIKDDRFPYDYLSDNQVSWYKEEVLNDTVNSLIFIHMPLMEYLEYEGDDIREKRWPQGKNTHLFDTIIETGKKSLGVFVGHDHNNEFSFYKEDILLAYGRSSGYNAYGTYEKGARIIIYDGSNLNTYLVGSSDE